MHVLHLLRPHRLYWSKRVVGVVSLLCAEEDSPVDGCVSSTDENLGYSLSRKKKEKSN